MDTNKGRPDNNLDSDITFEDALQTIKVRASKMEEISNLTSGKMAAILNFKNIEIINELTHKFKGKVVIANYNSGKQIIISGFSDSVDKFIKEAKNNGINKILPLNVSGAFHSPLMNNARIYLEKFIKSIVFKNTKTPRYQNYCPNKNFVKFHKLFLFVLFNRNLETIAPI